MSELEEIRAIRRERVKVAGLRGPGVARYFLNPTAATHAAGAARDKIQAEAPILRLVP